MMKFRKVLSAAAVLRLLRSNKLFWILFGLFVFNAVWIACSGVFSMAFDEYVHYGVIKLYAHQWSPFFAAQPAGADAFGAVARDPSYLYHYLMSFPLRLFGHFVQAFAAQIIFLRLFDIAFMAAGIVVFRQLFRRVQVSPLVTNLAMGFFLLLPVVPFMAAQVNYDPLVFLLTAVTAYYTVSLVQVVSTTGRLPLRLLAGLVAVALLASLVKYAFLPILVGVTAFLAVFLWRQRRRWWSSVRPGLRDFKSISGIVLLLFCGLAIGLFVERYGVNMVRYHSPTPECNQVMRLDRCMAYEPFARNYNYHAGHYDLPAKKIVLYPFNNWMRGMLRSLFFVVANKESGYVAGEPLPIAHKAGYIVLVGGLVLVLARLAWLWRQGLAPRLFLVLTATYAGLLYLQNFLDFLHTAVPVAIQGRYLVPILPFFLVLIAMAAVDLLRRRHATAGLLTVAVIGIMMLQGGGLAPWLLRAHDNWLWQAPVVRTLNHTGHDALAPFVLGD